MPSIDTGFVLPVDKPAGPTSHDVVGSVRRALRTRRVGHTGTLDPFATGLLLICVGPTTRLSRFITGLDKTYEAVARLGVTTDTLDHQGQIVEERPLPADLSLDDLETAMVPLRGEILQVPPQFSAKKVDGVAMHRRARRGETLELAPVPIRISSLELMRWETPDLTFRVECSSGSYVRALARDLGENLDVGGHLTELRRTRIGVHSVESAISLTDLENPDRLVEAAMSPMEAIAHLPLIEVDSDQEDALRMGQAPRVEQEPCSGPVGAVRDGHLVAVAEFVEGCLQPRTVLPAPGADRG